MNPRHIHFIGIGGIGMSGIARIYLLGGVKVSGSDLKENKITEELRQMGASIYIGHNARNIQGADLVIYSSAIKEDNPELSKARQEGIVVMKRGQALATLMQGKNVITVTGSHGKTTTASLASYLLLEAGFSPTVAVGGVLRNIDTNARIGDSDFFVAEADESDGSFLYYTPKYSIITNVDREHLDYYGDFDNEIRAFGDFMNRTINGGCLFICGDDKNLITLAEKYKGRLISFGLSDVSSVHPEDIKISGLASEFDCLYKDKFIARFSLPLGGRHNISNALSVIALGIELGIDIEVIKRAISGYKGAGRRIEMKFKSKDCLVFDDYAHHPTEIKATLSAIKNLKSDRLIAVFQPHRYTRTKLLMNEFAFSFDSADYVIITDIYPASEPPIEGVSAACLYDKMKEYLPEKQIRLLPKAEIVNHILRIIKPNDIVVTLGAGDIAKTCDELVERLRR